MNNDINIYTCILRSGERRDILQPFIAYDDDCACKTVENAIREDENIRAIALQERISLHKVCVINQIGYNFFVNPENVDEAIADIKHFRRFAQVVIGEQAVQKANELEATDND